MLLFGSVAYAQDSQFSFDPNGNLFLQSAAAATPPQIIGQPQNRIVAPDDSASFSVVVADARLLAYQWRFNGTNISGATNDAVLLQNVSTNNEGEYRVVLTNPSGSVTSAPAMLWIDSDADGVADSWERMFFTNLNQTATADSDGDGVSNLQEFRDGTNPTNNTAALYRLTVLRDGGSVTVLPDQSTYTNGQLVTLTANASGSEMFRAWLGDIVTRTNPITLVMTNNKTVSARFTPVVLTWTNFAGGDWNSATNWTPNLVPGSNDNVVISGLALQGPGTFTVTLDTPADCASVTLDTGLVRTPNLTGSGTLTVREHMLWRGGTMSGSGKTVIENGATLTLDMGETGSGNGLALNTRTLELGGNTFWTTGGNMLMNDGVITNRPGAVFHVMAAGSINRAGGAPRIDNAGTIRRITAGGITTVGAFVSFNNSGFVEIETGTLQLAGGGSANGMFNAAAGAMVEWTSGTYTLTPGAQLNGSGQYRLNIGNLTANADLTVGNLDMVHPNNTLSGTGAVTIGSAMNWMAGDQAGIGLTIVAPGATITVANPSQLNLVSRTLENGGTILWTNGNLALNNAMVTNQPGALFRATGSGTFGNLGGSPRFENAGTFRKSVSSGTLSTGSGLVFNNSGLVEIESGTLVVNGVLTNSGSVTVSAGAINRLAGGGSASGSFTASAGGIVEWTANTFTLNPGAQLNGSGLYRLNAGNVTANADSTVANLDVISGSSTWAGTGTVTITGAMNWPAGAMSGTGRTIIAPGAILHAAIPSQVNLVTRTLENGGTVIWTNGTIALNNAIITNRPGALFHALGLGLLGNLGGSPRFDNAGTFRKSINTGTLTAASGLSFMNYGTIDIRSGILLANGNLAFTSDSLLSLAIGGKTPGSGHGQLQKSGTIALNGALSVDLLPGYLPATNDTFSVVTAGTRTGTFASFSYPANRVALQLSNTVSAVVLSVTDVLPIPQPVLLAPEVEGSDFRLTWTATSNVTYRLEFNPDLNPTNWTALPNIITTLSNTASLLDPATSSNRIYRVRVLP